jgi:hypothetical protein
MDIKAKAQVVRCEVSKKGIETGIKFTDLDPESQDSIQRYVQSLDVQQDERIHENASQQHSVETSRPGESGQSPKSQSAKPERAKVANQGLGPLGTPLKKMRLRKLDGKRDSKFPPGAEILGRATGQPKPGKPFFIDLDSGRVLRTSKVTEYAGDRLRTKHSVYAIEVLDEFLSAEAGSPQVTVV